MCVSTVCECHVNHSCILPYLMWGLPMLCSLNPLLHKFLCYKKTHRCFESCLCLTGVPAAEMWHYLSNMNVIFNKYSVVTILKNWESVACSTHEVVT